MYTPSPYYFLLKFRAPAVRCAFRRGVWAIFALAAALAPLAHLPGAPAFAATPSSPLRPFVYGAAGSAGQYDIIYSDGANKDRTVARVKVESVFFADLSARLSTDGGVAAFRVVGDHLGGSSIYQVNVKSGKNALIASSKTAAEGIGAYGWSPAGNTLAYVRTSSVPDPIDMDGVYGTIYVYSVGFQAQKLAGSEGGDRFLSFSGDGLGVLVDRRETTTSGATLNNVVYLPLAGGKGSVLLRSVSDLRYSRCSVWAPSARQTKIACIAEGNFLPGTGKLYGPSSYGLMVTDLAGTVPALFRHDAERYPFLAWSPAGAAILAGGAHSGASWVIDMAGNQRPLGVSLSKVMAATWSAGDTQVVLADYPVTRLTTVDYAAAKTVATRYVGASPKAGTAAVRLNVPYIHQVIDTADTGDGNWACGPASVAMTLAYYGKISPWRTYLQERLSTAQPEPPQASSTAPPPAPSATQGPLTGADFGAYITSQYANNGHTYSSTAADPRGRMLAGLYGTICPTGFASWDIMQSVVKWHGLNSTFVDATWDGITGALKRGHPVILGNQLTVVGHIVLVVGYTADGNLIVNDPYGDRFLDGYGVNNGQGVLYPWKRVTPRHALEVIGVWPPPTATPTHTPASTATPTQPPATHTPTQEPSPSHTATLSTITQTPEHSPIP